MPGLMSCQAHPQRLCTKDLEGGFKPGTIGLSPLLHLFVSQKSTWPQLVLQDWKIVCVPFFFCLCTMLFLNVVLVPFFLGIYCHHYFLMQHKRGENNSFIITWKGYPWLQDSCQVFSVIPYFFISPKIFCPQTAQMSLDKFLFGMPLML